MILDDNLGPAGDAIYDRLMQAHEGLSIAQSHAMNARLVLILVNEIGDPNRIAALIAAARPDPRD